METTQPTSEDLLLQSFRALLSPEEIGLQKALLENFAHQNRSALEEIFLPTTSTLDPQQAIVTLEKLLQREKDLHAQLKDFENKHDMAQNFVLNQKRTNELNPLLAELNEIERQKKELMEKNNLMVDGRGVVGEKECKVKPEEITMVAPENKVKPEEITMTGEACKVKPEEITMAAVESVKCVEKRYEKKTAACNVGVLKMLELLTGSKSMEKLDANHMYDHLHKSKNWQEIPGPKGLQELANEGYIIVPAWKNPAETKTEKASGHVAMIVPGKESKSTTWDCIVPCTFDTGPGRRNSCQKLSEGFGKDKKPDVKYFIRKRKID